MTKTPHPDSLVTVASFGEIYQAQLFRTFLADHDVEGFVADQHMVAAHGPGLALGGLRVRVRSEDEARAINLLKKHQAMMHQEGEDFDWSAVDPQWADVAQDEDTHAKEACPQCASTYLSTVGVHSGVYIASLLLLGLPLLFIKPKVRCNDCGHEWK